MNKAKVEFSQRLLAALDRAGVPAKPTVIEREFNQRFWGKPITLHAARLWLRGETMPTHDRLLCLAEWLGVEPATLRYGDEIPEAVRERRKRWDEGIGYQEREIFELFLKLPVPQRKVAREVIIALARANGVLPLAGNG
ncbi:MAG: XRE family transcriptional regulator [Candidatus Contendobacter sp.]|jgi:transcriptional regulator with XRE-family HTH domain|nr:XRE family transcriptional regulator [Candidatus Contendobacter sp.]